MNKKVSKGISIGRTSSVPNRLHDSFKKLRPDRSTRRFLDQLQDGSIDIHALEQEAADLVNRLCFGSPLPPDSPTLTAMRIQETASDAHTLQMILNGDISDLAILPEALLSRNSIILPSGYTPSRSIEAWIRCWIPVASHAGPPLDKDLGFDAAQHIDELNRLASQDPQAATLVWNAQFRSAISLRWPFRSFSLCDSHRLVRTQAIILCVIISRLRIALLRQLQMAPVLAQIPSKPGAQNVARTIEAVLKPQAVLIKRLVERPVPGRYARDIEKLLLALPREHVVRHPDLLALAHKVAHRCIPVGLDHDEQNALGHLLLREVEKLVTPVTSLEKSDLREAGLGQMTMVKFRFNVDVGPASCLVAATLLDCPARIEACIAAATRGKPIPPVVHDLPILPTKDDIAGFSVGALIRTTELLRRLGKPDIYSERKAPGRAYSATDSQPSRDLVQRSLESFAQDSPAYALRALAIDPTQWFES